MKKILNKGSESGRLAKYLRESLTKIKVITEIVDAKICQYK